MAGRSACAARGAERKLDTAARALATSQLREQIDAIAACVHTASDESKRDVSRGQLAAEIRVSERVLAHKKAQNHKMKDRVIFVPFVANC